MHYMLMTLISTLRFWLLPSEVALVVTGCLLPNPEEVSLDRLMPFLTSQVTTAADLRIDKSWLYSSVPILSVCPMIFDMHGGILV